MLLFRGLRNYNNLSVDIHSKLLTAIKSLFDLENIGEVI